MAILASSILDRAATTLLDAGHTSWTAAEILDYLNEGQRAACGLKADCFTKVASMALAAGVDQALPTDGNALLNVLRNTASGKIVRQGGIDLMNATNASWPANTQELNVREYFADQRDPRRFQVNPPNNGAGAVTILYGAVPPEITSAGQAIALPDTYDTALWAFVVGMALFKNSRKQDVTKSAAFMQMFTMFVTGKTQTIKANAPDLKQVEQAQS